MIARKIASALAAIENCKRSGNTEWQQRHEDNVAKLVRDYLPRGSGVDNGTTLDESSTQHRLVFNTAFHHMSEHGYYDGWTDHRVIVTASLIGRIDVRVTGRDRNNIKEYLCMLFHDALCVEGE